MSFHSLLQTKSGKGKGGKTTMVKVKSYEDNSTETEGKTRAIYLLFISVAHYISDTEKVLGIWGFIDHLGKTKTKLVTVLLKKLISKIRWQTRENATGERLRNLQLVKSARNRLVTEDGKRGKIAKVNLCWFWLAELKKIVTLFFNNDSACSWR